MAMTVAMPALTKYQLSNFRGRSVALFTPKPKRSDIAKEGNGVGEQGGLVAQIVIDDRGIDRR